MIAGADASPGGEPAGVAEHRHVDADLGDNLRGNDLVDAGNSLQKIDLPAKWLHPVGYPSLQLGQIALDLVEPAQVQAQQKTMMLGQTPLERLDQVLQLGPQAALGQLGHRLGCHVPLDEGLQHGCTGHAEDIRRHTRQLDVGRLQQLERPIALGRQGFGKGSPMAQEITQLTDLGRRHEARSDQAVAHQVSNPFGIRHVSLAPWHRLDVVGIGNDQGEEPFEDGVDRLPIDAGALHPDMRHAQLPQPVAQGLEVGGHGAEVSDLLARFVPRATDKDTGDDAGLVDIQAGGTFNHHFHGSAPAW